MDQWERKLATRDTNRVVRPFEWGTDWLHSLGFPGCPADANGDSTECVARFATEAVADSERFFAYQPIADYRLEGSHLTFTSPVHTPYPENNTVHARVVPRAQRPRARGDRAAPVEFRRRTATWASPSCLTASVSAPCA